MQPFKLVKLHSSLSHHVVLACAFSFTCMSLAAAESVNSEPAERSAEAEFEQPPVVDVRALVAPEMLKSSNYALADKAEFNDYYCRFHLNSERFGAWDPSSLDQLKVRAHEMDVLVAVSDAPGGNGFGKGAVDKFKDTGHAIKDTVITPVKTFQAIGKGVSETTMNAFDFVRRKDRHQPKDAIFIGEQKRKLAAQWGVDAYTTNPAMQELLNHKARMREVGSALISVSMSIGASVLTPASIALTGVEFRENVEAKIEAYSAIHLYWYNDRILKKMDVESSDRQDFLTNEFLTPRQKTEIVADLLPLSHLSDKSGSLKLLSEKHPGEGVWQVQAADMLAKFNSTTKPIKTVKACGVALVARTIEEMNVVVFPCDILYWSKDVAQAIKDAMKETPGPGICLLTGQITPLARQEMERLGYTVHEHFLNN